MTTLDTLIDHAITIATDTTMVDSTVEVYTTLEVIVCVMGVTTIEAILYATTALESIIEGYGILSTGIAKSVTIFADKEMKWLRSDRILGAEKMGLAFV